tara:strand:+ start:40 stop:606 length:567 start_codon:yes stop_codon:yes gene_type:complete
MARKSKAKFELKGHTLPGINQKSETSNIKDGKSPSSAFQMESPMKQTTLPTYSGVSIDPMSSYDYKDSPKIPSFRDIVSLEQQQAYADKVDARRAGRAGRKKERQHRKDQDDYLASEEGQENIRRTTSGEAEKERQKELKRITEDYENQFKTMTNVDEGGDFNDENPANESSDENVLNTIRGVERDVN